MTNRDKVLKALTAGATLKPESVTYDGKESRTSTLSRTLMVTEVGDGFVKVLVGDPQTAGEQHPMRIDLPDTATYSNVTESGFSMEDKTGDDKARKFTYSLKPAQDQGQPSQIERLSEDQPERPTGDVAPGAAEEATDSRSDPQNLETPTQKKVAKKVRK